MKTIEVQGENKLIIENQEDFDTIANTLMDIQRKAAPIASALVELVGDHPAWSIAYDDIYFEDGEMYAKYETGGRGYYEESSIHIPSGYLFDDNWLEEAEEQIRIKKEKDAEKKRLAEIRKKKAAEDREYKSYLKLQEKFGGES